MSSCSNDIDMPKAQSVDVSTMEAEEQDIPKRELVASFAAMRASEESKPVCKVIGLKNVNADKALDTVSRVIPNLMAVKNDDVNAIVLRGDKNDVEEATKLISTIDKKIPQILIECKVVEISSSSLSDIGIIWGKEQGSFKFSVDKSSGGISQTDNILGTINTLIASGQAKLLASPKIAALDGKEAEINIGSRVPYAVPAGSSATSTQWTVQYIDAGVNLRILPSISSNGDIISTIKPEVSSISEWRTTSAGEFPVISTRNASVVVRMKEGETLAIGGLINETERENISRIPWFSDAPVIGGLFLRKVAEKTKTDVVFLITPHLMD
jgi:type II secretory pathway component GspD/PulD (secretin)